MDKITEQDLANRGVKGLPDVPGLTTEEMQRKLEEIAREILIPKVNELVEGLNNANSNLAHFSAPNIDNVTFRYNETDGKFELLYKGGNTYSLLGWNDRSLSYDYFNGTEWVKKWDLKF